MRNSCSFLEPNESKYNFFLSQIFCSCASMVVWLDVVPGRITYAKQKKPNETAIAHAVSYTTSIVLRSHTTLTVLRLSFQQVSIKYFVVRCQQYVAKAQRRHVFHDPRQKSYQHKTSETTSCGWADAKEFMSTQNHFNKFPWICDTTQVPLPGNHVQAHTRWLMSTQKRVNESPWHRYTMKCKRFQTKQVVRPRQECTVTPR